MTELTVKQHPLVRQGAKTPDDVQDQAFRLWVELGRSWRLVSQKTGIEERTLYRWGERGKWEERRHLQAASFLPGISAESAIALRLAAHNASIRLQQIMFDAKEYGVKPDREEVQSLSLAIDRGGFSPTAKGEHPNLHARTAPAADKALALSSVSDEDLDQLERKLSDPGDRDPRTRLNR